MTRKSSPKKRRVSKYVYKAQKIRHFQSLNFKNRSNFTAKQKRQISRLWNEKYKYVSTKNLYKAKGKKLRALKARGFDVVQKGVILDNPRDVHNKRIFGARVSIRQDGIVTEKIKNRTDHIISLTKEEKLAFVKNPEAVLKELRKKTGLKLTKKGPKTKRQFVRLQWGAYAGTIDYDLRVLMQYFTDEKTGRIKRRLLNKLTGIHFVTFGRKNGKKKTKNKK